MSKYRGTVKRNDLEGGFWELVTDSGEHYQLQGGDDGLHKDGLSVEVKGHVDKKAMGIGMTGPILVVKSYETL